jgi:hypothetical protein
MYVFSCQYMADFLRFNAILIASKLILFDCIVKLILKVISYDGSATPLLR